MIVTGTAPVKIESSDRFLSATSVGALQTTPQVTPAAQQVTPVTQPVVTSQSVAAVTQPVVTSQPAVTVTQPVVTSQPVVAVAQPVVTSQPAVTVTQPVVTSQPAVTVTQPVITPQPVAAVTQPVAVSQPVALAGAVHTPVQVRLVPAISIAADSSYRLQVGSFRVARNAVDAFDRLKNAGLTPNYERYTDDSNVEYYRVVIAGVKGSNVQATADKIGAAGFREAIIREEN